MLKPPVWKPEIAWYFFSGGLSGASAVLALGARVAGNRALARSALAGSLLGAAVSPPLLISDLGRPARFLNMLRVAKPTSPMSVGSWVLAGFGGCAAAAAAGEFLGLLRPLGRLAEVGAAALGLPLSTYTAVLVANTAVPVWHESRHELPIVFGAGAAASAGALATLLTAAPDSGPARRLAVLAVLVEVAAVAVMEHRLGPLGEPYREGRAATHKQVGAVLLLGGAALLALGRRRRLALSLGATMVLGGALSERFAIFRAGNPG